MARATKTTQDTLRRVSAKQRLLNQPLQTGKGRAGKPAEDVLPFLDQTHPVYDAWIDRWLANERRLAGGDDVIAELRRFTWETDDTPDGQYAQRQAEAVYTNFPDIYATALTGHLLRFAPKPDQGWAAPQLGKVTGRSRTPTQAEQVWYSIDNPSGAGSEWNQFWMSALKRAAATGHRWLYVDTPAEDAVTRAREQDGFRPYVVEFSPVDVPMWHITERDILEFVIIRISDPDPQLVDGTLRINTVNEQGYLLLVREGCTRLGARFAEGGWWRFTAQKVEVGHNTWDDVFGEIPMAILYYDRHKGTPEMPAISRPGTTELGQAAIAHMNLMSSANYNVWEAGGGVDYLAGVDEEAFDEVQRLERLGSRRLPLPPNSETDAVPQVYSSSNSAVSADIFMAREEALWKAATRLGIIEAAGNVNSGTVSEGNFAAALGPRIVWVATNLNVCQNNIIRYLELRYGHEKPTGQVNWPARFDLIELVDRIRGFFEIERLSGLRSKTADSAAMVMAAVDKGLVIDPNDKATIQAEYEESADRRDQLEQQAALQSSLQPGGMQGGMKGAAAATKDANREALKKSDRPKGKAGRPGPNQKPVNKSAPGVRR